MLRIAQPVRTVGYIVESAHLRDAGGEGVDVAVGPVTGRQLGDEPIVGNAARAHHEAIQGLHEISMRRRGKLAIIGHLAGFPEALDVGFGGCDLANVGVAGERFQHQNVLSQRRAHEPIFARIGFQRGPQRVDA